MARKATYLAFVVSAGLVLMQGCATQSVTTIDIDDDSVGAYILGVEPEGTLLNVYPSKISDGVHESIFFANSNFTGEIYGGYLVRQAKAGTRLGLVRIRVGGQMFSPCKDQKAITFEIEGGSLIYLGDLKFVRTGGRLTYTLENNLEAATAYVKTTYPEFSGPIEFREVDLFPSKDKCFRPEPITIHM